MKKTLIAIYLLMVSVIGLTLSPAFGVQDEALEEIKVYMGEVKVIPVNMPTRIAIGNPSVADVASASKNDITITPKAPGSTSLVYWDNFGEQAFRLLVCPENMQEIKRRVDNLLGALQFPEVYTKAVDEEGKVVLLGAVKTAQDRERILVALGAYKDKVLDLMQIKEEESAIEIDVQLLELTSDATKTLGFAVPGSITLTEAGSPALGTTALSEVGTSGVITGGDAIGTKWSTLFKVLNFSRDVFQFSLDALIQEGKARILSRPRLACQSGKEAELMVGGEKPIFSTDVVAGGGSDTNIEYKEYGIKLNIKPTVVEDGRLKLAVKVEVSEAGEVDSIGTTTTTFTGSSVTTTAKAFPLTKRNASTELYINDGQTMAIGGLIKRKSQEDIRRTPGLSDIPVLGLMVRRKTTKTGGGFGNKDDVELFITLTPKIVGEMRASGMPAKVVPVAKAYAAPTQPASPLGAYASLIQERIAQSVTYPASAKIAGFQGTVTLSLLLSHQGQLLDAMVQKSSGYKMLDDHAITVAKNIASYPPFPSAVSSNELRVEVPVAYQLE